MIYRITGIKNEIEWDGGETIRVWKIRKKGFLKKTARKNVPYKFYTLYLEDGSQYQISEARLIFLLRHKIDYEQIHGIRFLISQNGEVGTPHRKKSYADFKNIQECRETIDIIEQLQMGNPVPLYTRIIASRRLIISKLRVKGFSYQRIEELWDEALLRTEEKLQNMEFLKIQKIESYMVNTLIGLNISRRKLVYNDSVGARLSADDI